MPASPAGSKIRGRAKQTRDETRHFALRKGMWWSLGGLEPPDLTLIRRALKSPALPTQLILLRKIGVARQAICHANLPRAPSLP